MQHEPSCSAPKAVDRAFIRELFTRGKKGSSRPRFAQQDQQEQQQRASTLQNPHPSASPDTNKQSAAPADNFASHIATLAAAAQSSCMQFPSGSSGEQAAQQGCRCHATQQQHRDQTAALDSGSAQPGSSARAGHPAKQNSRLSVNTPAQAGSDPRQPRAAPAGSSEQQTHNSKQSHPARPALQSSVEQGRSHAADSAPAGEPQQQMHGLPLRGAAAPSSSWISSAEVAAWDDDDFMPSASQRGIHPLYKPAVLQSLSY